MLKTCTACAVVASLVGCFSTAFVPVATVVIAQQIDVSPTEFQRYTAQEKRRVLNAITTHRAGGAPDELRQVLLAGLSDSIAEVRAIALEAIAGRAAAGASLTDKISK